jgi:hypothetical protein
MMLCRDCKHYDALMCRHPRVRAETKAVLPVTETATASAAYQRSRDGLCGWNGRLFEPIADDGADRGHRLG